MTNDATCGPPPEERLTGRLHERGIQSVPYAHRLGGPLSLLVATPIIATPLQGGRPDRPGLLFTFFRRMRAHGPDRTFLIKRPPNFPYYLHRPRQHNEEMYKKVMTTVHKQSDATSR